MLGLDLSVRFAAPILPDTDYEMRWEIVSKVREERLFGWRCKLAGSIAGIGQTTRQAVQGDASAIIFDQ